MGVFSFIRNLPNKLHITLLMAKLNFYNRLSSKSMLSATGPTLSMTTYGVRFETSHLSLEAIARGKVRPSRAILFVDDEGLFNNPTKGIERLMKRGLELKLVENFGPHTKYYPFLELVDDFERPHATGDDDHIYPKWWLKKLSTSIEQEPGYLHAFRAHCIRLNEEGTEALPYLEWGPGITENPTNLNFYTSSMGEIYSPDFLRAAKQRGREFLDCCPKNDDLWLTSLAIQQNVPISVVEGINRTFPAIPASQQLTLEATNVFGGYNDVQIRETFTEEILSKLRELEHQHGFR
ncbi:MAG: Uncharacterised protein [Euryarchaeota archaeon UBA443]|nr:MAG: Uncharacterised protein [Euryarchaeota archaeon UBA443]